MESPLISAADSADRNDDSTQCARCGTPMTCAALAGETECWCAAEPKVAPNPAYTGCLCLACLRAEATDQREAR